MRPLPVLDEPAVDVAFALDGRSLPRDHAQALADALTARLPWLAAHPTAGVHPVKVVPGDGPQGWLSQRARLLLRVPQSLQPALAVLDGCTLGVAGSTLRLGPPTPHRLLPHGTLYAYFVAAASDDEAAFMRDVQAELDALHIDAHTVCGKRQVRHSDAGVVVGFSLMLHGLGPADSLTVQRVGIGPRRALGCGLFVPHKSAAAVGA
ncbi:MAG: CRISPR-associated protein Cas6, subtype [Proteobacteria bacterium]|jgi:CRISPR-associated protein Cas6|nr:CRISPR-associated protein Cas6, subtype [Pseudomonadota bacterium]